MKGLCNSVLHWCSAQQCRHYQSILHLRELSSLNPPGNRQQESTALFYRWDNSPRADIRFLCRHNEIHWLAGSTSNLPALSPWTLAMPVPCLQSTAAQEFISPSSASQSTLQHKIPWATSEAHWSGTVQRNNSKGLYILYCFNCQRNSQMHTQKPEASTTGNKKSWTLDLPCIYI